MANRHVRTFIQGFVIVAPVLLTAYVTIALAVWFYRFVDKGLGALGIPLPQGLEPWAPVLGILAILFAIYFIGLLAQNWLFRRLQGWAEALVERIPLIKSLYSAVKDLLQFLSGSDSTTRGVPARLKLMDGKLHMMALITQKRPEGFMGEQESGRIAVYLPMSYQIGGFTVFVDPGDVEELEGLTVEDILKLSMTAGVGAGRDAAGQPSRQPPQEPEQQAQ